MIDPADLPDSQLLEINKDLGQLNDDLSRILDKVTKYAGNMSELGASSLLEEVDSLVASTVEDKEKFEKGVRKIPKFCRYDSAMDIYTFREQVEFFSLLIFFSRCLQKDWCGNKI